MWLALRPASGRNFATRSDSGPLGIIQMPKARHATPLRVSAIQRDRSVADRKLRRKAEPNGPTGINERVLVAARLLPKGSFANIVERANRKRLLGYRYAFVIQFEIVEKYSIGIKSTQQNLIRLALPNYRYQILRRQIVSHHTL